MASRVFIDNRKEPMPGTIEVPVTEPLWLDYGKVGLSLIVPTRGPEEELVLAPQRDVVLVLDRSVPHARRRIQDMAVPALEELVERHGAPITPDQEVKASVTEPLIHDISAKASCAVMADVEEEELESVLLVQVLRPFQREVRQELEPPPPSRSLISRVQGLIHGLGAPVRR